MSMYKEFVYIDDSGDPGLMKSSTSHFIVAAVLVVERENLNNLIVALDGFRAGLGWNELHELKFNSTKKSIIKNLLRFVQRFDFEAYAAVIDKTKMIAKPKLASGESLYHFTIKELLLRLDLSDAVVFIDGVAHKRQAERIRTYLRRELKGHGVSKYEIKFVDSRKNALIQLADIVAGSIARSYDKEKHDHNDYFNLLKSKVKEIYEVNP